MENKTIRRTSGDGMEHVDSEKSEVNVPKKNSLRENNEKPIPTELKKSTFSATQLPSRSQYIIYRPQDESHCLSSVIPQGKLYCLIPKLIKPNPQKNENCGVKKFRQPKFIPIEPYKAAVNPVFPKKKQQIYRRDRNNLDINFLVSQMSRITASELNTSSSNTKDKTTDGHKQTDSEKQKLMEENKYLEKEKDRINGQLKFQLQVNAELKNLLVASVGEDLQTRVNFLTEDKLQLAKALLDTTNSISTHTEQIEFLAGQCEVWRSKFLASSVMIEELAKCKADLMQRNSLLVESVKQILQLTSELREMQIDVLENVKFLANMKSLNIHSSDIISLTTECLNITQQLVLHTGVGMPECLNLDGLCILTPAEKFAVNVLQSVSQPLTAIDETSKAIIDKFSPNSVAQKKKQESNIIDN